MSNLNNLKITEVADLRNEATNFQSHATEVRNVTDRMLDLITSTYNVWRGDAGNKYRNQFQGLGDDMHRIYDMCEKYSTDLIEIANTYEKAEGDNAAEASSLKADFDMVRT